MGWTGRAPAQQSKTAGMEVDEQRRVTGDHIVVNERFFVTIKEVSDAEKRMKCDGSEYGLVDSIDGSHANRCLINYDVEFFSFDGKFSRFDRHVRLSERECEVHAIRLKPFRAL